MCRLSKEEEEVKLYHVQEVNEDETIDIGHAKQIVNAEEFNNIFTEIQIILDQYPTKQLTQSFEWIYVYKDPTPANNNNFIIYLFTIGEKIAPTSR